MATTKSKPAAKKTPGTALAKWDEALAAKARAAKKVASAIGGGSKNVLSFKGGRMSYQGGNVPGNTLEVVVLSAINENNYFEGKYDPNNPAAPSCYAFGRADGDDENMGPNKEHFKGHEKDIQTETGRCADCQHNEWGSAETGRGKRCKNIVSLAMVTADALESPEAMEKAEVFYAKLPVTSGKAWKGLVNELGDRHFVEFVVRIGLEPSGETYVVTFETVNEVPRALIGALLDKSDKEDGNWGRDPYPVFEAPVAMPRNGRRAAVPAKKAAPAKKPTRKY